MATLTSLEKVRVGSDLHKDLLKRLCERKDFSQRKMLNRRTKWEKDDQDFTMFVKERDTDAQRRQEKAQGVKQFVDIDVSMTYAMVMTAHTYLSTVFLSRNPVFQYSGRHGESEMNVQAVESLMDYQMNVGVNLPAQYIWLLDVLKYGVGILWDYWHIDSRQVSTLVDKPVTIDGIEVVGRTQRQKVIKRVQGYEGNKLFNVRPYDYLPDPRVSLSEPQKGEFVGRLVEFAWNTLTRRKLSKQYINIDKLKEMRLAGGGAGGAGSGNLMRFQPLGTGELPDTQGFSSTLLDAIPGFEMVVDLVPNEWGLGTTEHPEKWVFAVADDKVIIEVHPYGMYHDEFPSTVLESEFNPYSLFKRSMFEIGRPLNDTMSWLFNTHFYNVRKSLNGEIVFDPSRLNASDVMSKEPGKRIRLKPIAYGTDVRTMLYTIPGGSDVTGTHLQDTNVVGDLLQKVMGINENIMGALSSGGRKTATEVRTASSSSVNRMRTLAEYLSGLGYAPLSQRMLQTTQQMYTGERKFRIAGDTVNTPESFMNIDADAIGGFYDFVAVDGTLPIDRFAIVNMWGTLLAQISRMPEIMASYDMGRIFEWIAQLGGIKNIRQFRLNVQSPEVLAAQAQAGNITPAGGSGGGGGGTTGPSGVTGGGAGPTAAIPIPRQVTGVGPSG